VTTPPHRAIVRAAPRTRPLVISTLTGNVEPAGFVSRFVAFVIDLVLVGLGAVLFSSMINLILRFFGLATQVLNHITAGQVSGLINQDTVVLDGIVTILFIPAYFVVCWALVGATPGKQVLGLKVIDNDLLPNVAWRRAILRFIGYFISAIPFFMGFWWVIFDRRRECWHDKLAKTHVIYTWEVPTGE
jgi:uncharacterized RDD family membrane protein YckC